jgi:hypothetical protein
VQEQAERAPNDDAGENRLAVAMLLSVLLSAGLLLLAAWIGESVAERPVVHPEIPGMMHGGQSAARTGPVLWIGAVFGLAQIGFFGLCFALGMRGRGGLGPVSRPLWIALSVFAGVWLALVWSYLGYAADPIGTSRWLGFPLPTAILLFGFWPLPLLFVAIYLRYFDEMVIDEERLARFRTRLAALRRERRD